MRHNAEHGQHTADVAEHDVVEATGRGRAAEVSRRLLSAELAGVELDGAMRELLQVGAQLSGIPG